MSCITEILKIKGDKEFFKFLDIVVEGGGIYRKYEYLVILNTMGHRCGYVAIPPDLTNFDEDSIDCHGGITFFGNNHVLKNLLTTQCLDNWIGFDCRHHYDAPDIEAVEKYHGKSGHLDYLKDLNALFDDGTVKSFDYVKKECKSIIIQLEAMPNGQ